jgi:hypothetical protein
MKSFYQRLAEVVNDDQFNTCINDDEQLVIDFSELKEFVLMHTDEQAKLLVNLKRRLTTSGCSPVIDDDLHVWTIPSTDVAEWKGNITTNKTDKNKKIIKDLIKLIKLSGDQSFKSVSTASRYLMNVSEELSSKYPECDDFSVETTTDTASLRFESPFSTIRVSYDSDNNHFNATF